MVDTEDVGIGESLNDYAKSLGGGYKTKKKSPKKSKKSTPVKKTRKTSKGKRKDPRLSALGEGTKYLY